MYLYNAISTIDWFADVKEAKINLNHESEQFISPVVYKALNPPINEMTSKMGFDNAKLINNDKSSISRSFNDQINKPVKGKKKGLWKNGVYNLQPDWGFDGEMKFISVVPNDKLHIKWDRRIVFPPEYSQMIESGRIKRTINGPSNNGYTREFPEIKVLQSHPIISISKDLPLEEVLYIMKNSDDCKETPIFLTMGMI